MLIRILVQICIKLRLEILILRGEKVYTITGQEVR